MFKRRLLPGLFGLLIVLALMGLRAADPYPVEVVREIAFDLYQRLKPREIPAGSNTTSIIGWLLMGDFSLLFVASSIAILVALVGAAMIARSDRLSPEEAAERM